MSDRAAVLKSKGHGRGGPLRRHRPGFSLIEVLVVVAVITLLIAILLPSLARSREQTRTVACRSNLRQWGNAMTMYAQAFNGTLPYEDRGEEESHGRVCWFDALDRYGIPKGERGVRVCPTVTISEPTREESYRFNSKLCETSEDPGRRPYYMPYRKLSSLKRPVQTVLLFDGDVGGNTVSFKGRWRQQNDDVNYRHNVGSNLLFLDWHVDWVLKKPLYEQSIRNEPIVWQPPDMGEWNPNPNPEP